MSNYSYKKKDNILVLIFARVWALWAMLSFVITFLIIFIPSMLSYLIPNPKGQSFFIKVSKIWIEFWLHLVLCPVTIRGKENFIKGNTYIVTCNHNTLLDVPITCPYIPGANRTIAKKSFTKVPIFGWFYARGSVLVDRNSNASRIKSFEEMKQTLQQKMHMCIYPEGTRNRSGQPLKKFYDGAFKLAVDTQTSVIPTLLFNSNKAMPNNKFFYFVPQKLEMHFLPAISTENLSTEELKEKVFKIMWDYYEANK